MKSRIILLITGVVFMLSAPAWAAVDRLCNPEFDAVGCDATNPLAQGNPIQFANISNNIVDAHFRALNWWSDFTYMTVDPAAELDPAIYPLAEKLEYFTPNDPNLMIGSPCYPFHAIRATPESVVEFEWAIVLQMEPESDINVSIYDCVMQGTGTELLEDVGQTGRFYDESFIKFLKADNPSMTIKAYPGRNSDFEPFILDARKLPTLCLTAMDENLYTSKAHWDESIVCVRPENGAINQCGETTYKLKQGDRIKVTVKTQPTNRNDVYYGEDSVMLKYIGYNRTFYYADQPCEQ